MYSCTQLKYVYLSFKILDLREAKSNGKIELTVLSTVYLCIHASILYIVYGTEAKACGNIARSEKYIAHLLIRGRLTCRDREDSLHLKLRVV
jgi:hypothetical protein